MSKGVFIFLVLIILILSGALLFRDKQLSAALDYEKSLRDSISTLSAEIDSSHVRQAKLQSKIDSLSSVETKVITTTHDKINFIYSTATPSDLDSIIRSAWKVQSRYH
jgi:hypothetical protein